MTIRTRAAALSIFVVGVLALAGCAAEGAPQDAALAGCAAEGAPQDAATQPDQSTASSAPAEPDVVAEEEAPAVAVTQAEDCGWGSGPIVADAAGVPSGTDGALDVVLIGAWQHTHFDTGAGYEPLGDGTDIRYIFPSTDRLLYCQDVAGATQQAENAADMTLDGTELVLPSPASGYNVVAWDANTMVWENHRDGSHYLLTRR